jgi:FkbM family methyltransferase
MKEFLLTPFKFREIKPKIESNHKYIKNVNAEKFLTGWPLNKYWTFDFIETISDYIDFDTVKTIFDIGSRDGHQSVELRNWFPEANITAFEANPYQIKNLTDVVNDSNINLEFSCVGNRNGTTAFNLSPSNIGASSVLKINDHRVSKDWAQYEIEVPIIRVDDYCKTNNISKIDLLWMDVQGFEIPVFEGFGKMLEDVSAICTEVELVQMYNGATLKKDLDEYLLQYGFKELKVFHMCPPEAMVYEKFEDNCPEVDVVYINKKYLNE